MQNVREDARVVQVMIGTFTPQAKKMTVKHNK